MPSPAPRVVKTVPINAGNGWNPSDWYTGNMTPPVPQPNGTLQQANWTDISNNPSTPLGAINAAVPGANGSIIPNKDLSQLAPSPAGLPALYGQPMPPVFGGSWANFADSMGSAWPSNGLPAGMPPSITVNGGDLPPFDWSTVPPDSAFGGAPGLSGILGGGAPSPPSMWRADVPQGQSMYERNPTYRALVDNPVSTATTGRSGVGTDLNGRPIAAPPIPPMLRPQGSARMRGR